MDKVTIKHFLLRYLRNIGARMFHQTKTYCKRILQKVRVDTKNQTIQQQVVSHWFRDNGDKTFRLNYNLCTDSIVFDMGGYEGQWASDIFAKYCCTIHVFEPVLEFADNIEKRFAQNPKIIIHRVGLADRDQAVQIHFVDNQSSMYTSGTEVREAKLISAKKFIDAEGIKHVDLMKINIEGGEYDLLDHLIDTGLVKQIANIQVQFHDHVPNAERRMQKIQQALQKTHYLTYQYPFVWENWKRIEPTDAQQNL
jgi:FkbM family methyltransferase